MKCNDSGPWQQWVDRYRKVEAAIRAGDIDRIQALLNQEARVTDYDFNGTDYLTLAAQLNKTEIGRLLIARGANVNHQNKDGDSALMFCGETGNVDLARAILAVPYANLNLRNCQLNTAAHLSVINMGSEKHPARGHHLSVLHVLGNDPRIDLKLRNSRNYTVYMEAANVGHAEAMRFLASKEADTNIEDRPGHSIRPTIRHARARRQAELMMQK